MPQKTCALDGFSRRGTLFEAMGRSHLSARLRSPHPILRRIGIVRDLHSRVSVDTAERASEVALNEGTLNRVHMPHGFFEAVSSALQPGTTILVTQSSVGALTTGEHITILDSVVPQIRD